MTIESTHPCSDCAVSVLVLTKNEEHDILACLQSVAWSDDIHVFDSYSSDATVAIARGQGVHVSQRHFEGYASQRNAALHGLPFRHRWVLIVDADERIPPRTGAAVAAFAATAPESTAAARLRRRDMFMGKWLRFAQISPYFVRLVRPERVRYIREVNEVLTVDGSIDDLHEPFDHYPFSKGMGHWLDKHNTYSTMEAKLIAEKNAEGIRFSLGKALFGRDFNERRFHQKALFYRLPMRPVVKWLYMVFARAAFLDGRPGLAYATLQAFYEYMIVLKTRELEHDRIQPRKCVAPAGAADPGGCAASEAPHNGPLPAWMASFGLGGSACPGSLKNRQKADHSSR